MNEKPFVSVICEYNPFHFGHLYQMETLKKEFSAVVCILSGNMVQRGSVAVADKYLRAEAAVKNGASLVLELPVPWCCSSAKDFARAGVHIAESIGSEYLAFGSENSMEELMNLDSLVSSHGFENKIASLVESNKTMSYPVALKHIISQELGEEYGEMAGKPNNILSLEYLSAMKGKNIKPYSIKRNMDFKSSSAIRSLEKGELVLDQLPPESKNVFSRELGKDFPRNAQKLDSFFLGTLRRMASEELALQDFYSTPVDLARKIFANSVKSSSLDELIIACSDKVYTYARVRRAVNSLVFGIKTESVRNMPPYTCVLAADGKGREILKNAKKLNSIDIVTKPVRALLESESTAKAFSFAKGIEDILSLSSPAPIPSDSGKTPFITGE